MCIKLVVKQFLTLNELYTTLSVSKNISNVFACNLKKDYQISINFGTSTPETTGHKMVI